MCRCVVVLMCCGYYTYLMATNQPYNTLVHQHDFKILCKFTKITSMTIHRTNFIARNPRSQVFMDFMFLLLCGFIGALIGALITQGVMQLANINDVQETVKSLPPDAPASERNMLRAILMIGHLFLFWFASLAFAYLIYKKQFIQYLQLHRSPSIPQLSYSGVIVFLSLPVVFLIYWLNQQIPLPEILMGYENDAEALTKQLLIMNSHTELLFNLAVIALVPAVGEELMFRGVIQQLMTRLSNNEHLGVWLAGFLFSAIHLQFQGFLPRMFLGGVLGYFLLWTKSLWVPIFAHFVFNGMQLIAQYFAKVNIEEQEPDVEKLLPFGLFSIIIVGGLCWSLYKNSNHEFTDKAKSEIEN